MSVITEESGLVRKVSTNTRKEYDIERSVFPSLSNFLERLDDQLWKSYAKCNNASLAYLKRINDENELLFLIDKVGAFLSEFELDMYRARIAVIKLQYLYYKNDSLYD